MDEPERSNEPEESSLEKKICDLWKEGMREKKAIARRLNTDVRSVRNILERHGLSQKAEPVPDKLAPFHASIRELLKTGLNNARILSEIKGEGYAGGKTILDEYLRPLRGPAKRATKAFRRFETEPAVEAQADWTTHRVVIGGVERVVHFFAMILAWSRYLFIGAYRDEKLPTLLGAHVEAFEFFGGVTSRIVYDNMSTVVVGRRGRDVIWNPRLLAFARHWGYDPFACQPARPDRKGKIEAPFLYHGNAFIKGRAFESWDQLESEQRAWLDVANARLHGTTRCVPIERWEHERPLLTRAPETAFPAYREEHRSVYHDCTISVGNVKYSVPSSLANRTVAVRVHLRHIEVLDDRGVVHARHKIHEPRDGVVIDPLHYADIRRGPGRSASDLEARFLNRFPGADAFLLGLKRKMKSFAHLHTVQIERLATKYGTAPTDSAIVRAAEYGNFSASAIKGILRDRYPLLAVEPRDFPGTASAAANHVLVDETDTGSLDDYDLDRLTDNQEDDDGSACALAQ